MTMVTPSCRKLVVSKTRLVWARSVGAGPRFSQAQLRAALRKRSRAGWIVVLPDGRARHERVTLLQGAHPLAATAREYQRGKRWFDRSALENALGLRLDSKVGACGLAAAGFVLMGAEGPRVELQAADPRVARLVNCARLGPQRRGYKARSIIEAVLYLPPKNKRRHRVTEERRLEAALSLQDEYRIDADDLLNCRACARLRSTWTI
jgi:hypothetical protein